MTISHQARIPRSAYKLAVFATVTALMTGILATVIGNVSFADSRTYYAMFTDATGVFKGDRVRLSGVEVGSVQGTEIVDRPDGTRLAKIEFSVKKDVPIYADAQLQLRYENLVGQRYLAISESSNGREPMASSDTFPPSQTTPALNLTQLFNGFQPLFRALKPAQVNEFSFEIVRAFQGDTTNLTALMHDTAELTNGIADHDIVLSRVIDNLNSVLSTIGTRDTQLAALIMQFRDLMTGLADDGNMIDAALPDLASLLGATAETIEEIRGPLSSNVDSLKVITRHLYDTRDELEDSLHDTPRKLKVLTRAGSYGSWFNFYACSLTAELQLLDGTLALSTPDITATEDDTVCAGGIEE